MKPLQLPEPLKNPPGYVAKQEEIIRSLANDYDLERATGELAQLVVALKAGHPFGKCKQTDLENCLAYYRNSLLALYVERLRSGDDPETLFLCVNGLLLAQVNSPELATQPDACLAEAVILRRHAESILRREPASHRIERLKHERDARLKMIDDDKSLDDSLRERARERVLSAYQDAYLDVVGSPFSRAPSEGS